MIEITAAIMAITLTYCVFYFLVIKPERDEEFDRRERVAQADAGWHVVSRTGLMGTIRSRSPSSDPELGNTFFHVELAAPEEERHGQPALCVTMTEVAIARVFEPGTASWLATTKANPASGLNILDTVGFYPAPYPPSSRFEELKRLVNCGDLKGACKVADDLNDQVSRFLARWDTEEKNEKPGIVNF